jgi:hypothetical protein
VWWRGLGSDGSSLGLPADLVRRLLEWNRRYEDWASTASQPEPDLLVDFRVAGLRLAAEVQEHVGSQLRVSYLQAM